MKHFSHAIHVDFLYKFHLILFVYLYCKKSHLKNLQKVSQRIIVIVTIYECIPLNFKVSPWSNFSEFV